MAIIAIVLLALAPWAVQAQSLQADETFEAPRTSWGDPDLQGVWTNTTLTPFERPAALADKAFLSDEEVAELEKDRENLIQSANAAPSQRTEAGGNVGAYNLHWLELGTKIVASRRTSLVIDPADGRVPVRPEAEARRDYHAARIEDSFRHMSVWDRCITRGVPGGMLPAGYNNGYHILQAPGYVAILSEMIHNTRIIPIDGRPHVAADIRLWNGDSRGHWEGETLVVETTNFSDRGWIATSGSQGRIKGIPVTEGLHVVERFTRIDDETIDWQATIEDPEIYTAPWTVSIPLYFDPNYQIFEYACHEGNWAVRNTLSAGRAREGTAPESP